MTNQELIDNIDDALMANAELTGRGLDGNHEATPPARAPVE